MEVKSANLCTRITKFPKIMPVAIEALTKEELDAEIEKGYADMLAGYTEPAEKVFTDIRREYGI